MTRSLHDNFVLGYSVDAEAASIVIRTEYRDQGAPFERTNARFEGVVVYLFRDNLGGILFDITEESMEYILRDYAGDFEWGTRYGWPWVQAGAGDPHGHVTSLGAKAFRVQSSIGFDGFIVAKSFVVEAADQADAEGRPSDGADRQRR